MELGLAGGGQSHLNQLDKEQIREDDFSREIRVLFSGGGGAELGERQKIKID